MLIQANALQLPLRENSVHCVVTSPPYWGLRDYAACSCVQHRVKDPTSTLAGSAEGTPNHRSAPDPDCPECHGSGRLDVDQLGLESTPEEYVAKMVDVFREVWRVLRPSGTLWLNLGDSYASDTKGSGGPSKKQTSNAGSRYLQRRLHHGMKQKDLCGIPWRVAFALQAEGWFLRSDIIWAKPNPMPESVQDRPTKSHEYLFLLTKRPTYYYDHTAILEPAGAHQGKVLDNRTSGTGLARGMGNQGDRQGNFESHPNGRNKRSVWTITTKPTKHAHFATFPPNLVRPCILAGTSAKGCCDRCGAPWIPVREAAPKGAPVDYEGKWSSTHEQSSGRRMLASTRGARSGSGAGPRWAHDNPFPPPRTIGWEPSCRCGHLTTKPCTVFDPFCGSGTTILVAEQLNRRGVGTDLSYQDIAKTRTRHIQRQLLGFEEEWTP